MRARLILFHDTKCITIHRLITVARNWGDATLRYIFLSARYSFFFKQKCYPLHMLFFNLFYKVCKWQVYISLVIELLPYIRRHVMTMLLQMFPVVNLSTCFYTSMINQAMHDGLNVIR